MPTACAAILEPVNKDLLSSLGSQLLNSHRYGNITNPSIHLIKLYEICGCNSYSTEMQPYGIISLGTWTKATVIKRWLLYRMITNMNSTQKCEGMLTLKKAYASELWRAMTRATPTVNSQLSVLCLREAIRALSISNVTSNSIVLALYFLYRLLWCAAIPTRRRGVRRNSSCAHNYLVLTFHHTSA